MQTQTETTRAIDLLASVISVIYRSMQQQGGMTVEELVFQAERINEAAAMIGESAAKNVRVTGADVD
jgi:hypothetical protein